MKMSPAYSSIFMQIKVIFIRMISHLDSLWNRGTRELGNGLLETVMQIRDVVEGLHNFGEFSQPFECLDEVM